MKKVTKVLASAAAVAAIFFTTNVNAQTPKLGIGVNVGVPTSDQYKFALGADARLQFDVSKQVSIPVTAGYTHFFSKDYTIANVNVKQDYGYIPVKAGIKLFFDQSGSGVYALGEAGAAFGVTDGSKTGFLYSPALGYSWSNGLDLGVKYEGISGGRDASIIYPKNTGQVALRIAYGFKL